MRRHFERKLENEGEAPENWLNDTVLTRDENGEVRALEVPDDNGGESDAADD